MTLTLPRYICPLLGAAHFPCGGAVAAQGDTDFCCSTALRRFPGVARAELSSRRGLNRPFHPSVAHGEVRGSVISSLVAVCDVAGSIP